MQVHYNLIIKFFLFIALITFSFYFFYSGFYELKKSDIGINSKSNIYSSNKVFDKKDVSKNNNINSLTIHEFEKTIINEKKDEEEKVIIVKKNDTFSKLIDPFIANKKNKQKIISLINNEYK